VHSDSNPVAGHSRLRHLEQRAANPITVTDANLIVRQSLHREVLAELSKHEIPSPQLLFPIAIGFDLVDENGPVLSTVPLQTSLAIAVDVQPCDLAAPPDRVLPHGRPCERSSLSIRCRAEGRRSLIAIAPFRPSSWDIPGGTFQINAPADGN